jgi:hypothetical protein
MPFITNMFLESLSDLRTDMEQALTELLDCNSQC